MRLCEADWFRGSYFKVYKILSMENMLPHPCMINILEQDRLPGKEDDIVAACWKEDMLVWFKFNPPKLIHLAHELVHLMPKDDERLEEVYAYVLSHLTVMLVERNIMPPANPIRLFNRSFDYVEETVRKMYDVDVDKMINPLIEAKYGKTIAILVELVKKAYYDERAFKVLLMLLFGVR